LSKVHVTCIVTKCAHMRFTKSNHLVTQVDSNFIREFLQYRLLDTVNVSIEIPINFIFRVKRRNWLDF